VCPICCGRDLSSGGEELTAKALEDQGDEEAAGERAADEGLGAAR
jgi:hypothetical protein